MKNCLRALLVTLALTLCGCRTPNPTPSSYFPADFYGGDWPGSRIFRTDWYGKHLIALAEPALHNRKGDFEVYRFLWLRSFHSPWSFRVEVSKANGTARLFAKRTDGKGGYDAGRLAESRIVPLTGPQLARLRALIKAADLWNVPPRARAIGCDGSQWIVEAYDGTRYCIIDRWTPKDYPRFPKAKEYIRLCLYLMELAHAVPTADDYY